MIDAAVLFSALLASAIATIRWLRVAQREHYLPGSVGTFAARWWKSRGVNLAGLALAIAAAVASVWFRPLGLVTVLVVLAGPWGLGLRGRTSPLAWTPRLRRVAGVSAFLAAVLLIATKSAPIAVFMSLALPLLVDGALAILWPLESRWSARFVRDASRRLAAVAPVVVAITGSFGKTSTKTYAGRMLQRRRETVVSPASFNNRLGLARSINEQLATGTEVFVAEMGTYSRGEIRELCSWIPPTVSVITGIGPVHLERFGTLDEVAAAKAEIVDDAASLVLNVDYPWLADLATAEESRRQVIRCSVESPSADVFVGPDAQVRVHGRVIGAIDSGEGFPGNVACAIGVLISLGMTPDAQDLATMERPLHRQQIATAASGAIVIDDTYNANPAGARAALAALDRHASDGSRRVIVTPGIIELGHEQYAENVELAARAAQTATDIVIVGRTNRKALLEGSRRARSVKVVDSREEGVAWVRRTLGPGDVVLYENDLPDHYP